jgi:hypothetical protein
MMENHQQLGDRGGSVRIFGGQCDAFVIGWNYDPLESDANKTPELDRDFLFFHQPINNRLPWRTEKSRKPEGLKELGNVRC